MPAKYRERGRGDPSCPTAATAILVEGRRPTRALPRPQGGADERDGQPFGTRSRARPAWGRRSSAARAGAGRSARRGDLSQHAVGPRLWRALSDDERLTAPACARTTTGWPREYCAVSRDRLIGMGVIPWTNLDDAWPSSSTARLGLKGVNLACFPTQGVSAARGRPVLGRPPST